MILLPQSLVSPRTTRFYRRYRAFAGVAAGRTRKPAFVPLLAALEDRTLLTTLVVDPVAGPYTTTVRGQCRQRCRRGHHRDPSGDVHGTGHD